MRQDFVITISHQEHATWQGTVTWLNENKIQHFRSAMELLRLIDSTMDNGAHRDWEEVPPEK